MHGGSISNNYSSYQKQKPRIYSNSIVDGREEWFSQLLSNFVSSTSLFSSRSLLPLVSGSDSSQE